MLPTTPSQSVEHHLWQAFRAGDDAAWRALYRQYYRTLLDYGVRQTRERDLTADCLQDFFLYVWNHRESLGCARSVKVYLFTSFKRRLFKYVREKRAIDYRTEP